MHSRHKARVLVAALIVVAFVLITIDFRAGGAGAGNGPLAVLRRAVTAVLGPAQDGLTSVIRPVADAVSGVGDLVDLRADNQRLRERVVGLEQQRRSLDDLRRENAQLRDLLAIGPRADFDLVVARTVALGPSNFEWTITIDAGADAGVARDMVVVTGAGLVGRVVQATPDAARVLLAIDPNFSAAARLARSGETGTVDGRGGDPMLFRPLDPEADIEPGDEIVTSSYSNGVFPPGIPVGTVAQVDAATTRLTREVLVRPYVDFTRLDQVAVIRSAPVAEVPPPEPDAGLDFTPPDATRPRDDPPDAATATPARFTPSAADHAWQRA